MSLFHNSVLKTAFSLLKTRNNSRSVIGIYDFSYAPFALGDVITWVMNLLVLSERKNAEVIKIFILCSQKDLPNKLQPYINNHNYLVHLQNIIPAFSLSKKIQSVSVIQDKQISAREIAKLGFLSDPTWPHLWSHYKRKLNYSDHKQINKFFKKCGYLPMLSACPKIKRQAYKALFPILEGKFPVILNIRQRGNTNNPAALHRDGDIANWVKFLEFCNRSEKDFIFLLVGDPSEFDRDILKLENILIPRVYGMGLEHELALIIAGMPFLGNSSGFSACATFSKAPYAIIKFEHAAAKYIELPVGSTHYPFAHDNQRLFWDEDSFDLILNAFEKLKSPAKEFYETVSRHGS